jgi:FdhD protein
MTKQQNFTEKIVRRIKSNGEILIEQDALAVEEPLEIRLGFAENGKAKHKSISITMRTPGDDFELAAGFLFTEGIIKSADQINRIKHCGVPVKDSGFNNTVRVDLRADVAIDFKRLERHFYTSSSCGVCGKTSIEALQTGVCSLAEHSSPVFASETIHRLPEILRSSQNVFDRTGGLHAAALFNTAGEMESLREDVGRHNAVDKLIGTQFLAGKTPVSDKLLLVSGRASFELVQKALMAGIPILAAVGAPSSLAVELAGEYGMTLLGFVRDNRFNIYCGAERIKNQKHFADENIESVKFKKAKASIISAQ